MIGKFYGNYNWLYKGIYEYTMTRNTDSGSTMEVYDTKEKALEDFNERIRNAKIDSYRIG